MDDSNKLRVGIVGCGYQGGWLARAIALVDSLTLTACADIIPERAVFLTALSWAPHPLNGTPAFRPIRFYVPMPGSAAVLIKLACEKDNGFPNHQ